jgi:tRNA A-37 threonylcarbamoyl transferase component Bud32
LDPDPSALVFAESADVYTLLQTISVDRTFLCHDVSSNIVVLKKLDEDCLHRGQLHPNIKERLARVRDLPHPRLATLRAVERWNDVPCIVWTWMDGETWDDALGKSTESFAALAGGLVDAVDALHELGIVHGKLHGRNIIVAPDKQVWLTDISPYLYTDQSADINAVIRLLDGVSSRLDSNVTQRLQQHLDDLACGAIGLRELSQALRSVGDAAEDQLPLVMPPQRYRKSSLAWAMVLLLIGAGVAAGAYRYLVKQSTPLPTTFPSLIPQTRLSKNTLQAGV